MKMPVRPTIVVSAAMSSAVMIEPVGIVRRVDHQQPRARRDRVANGVPVDPIVRQAQRYDDRHAAVQLDGRNVRVVARLQDDHLIAGMDDGRDRVEDRFGAAGGDGDLGVGIVAGAVVMRVLRGDGLTQRGTPCIGGY